MRIAELEANALEDQSKIVSLEREKEALLQLAAKTSAALLSMPAPPLPTNVPPPSSPAPAVPAPAAPATVTAADSSRPSSTESNSPKTTSPTPSPPTAATSAVPVGAKHASGPLAPTPVITIDPEPSSASRTLEQQQQAAAAPPMSSSVTYVRRCRVSCMQCTRRLPSERDSCCARSRTNPRCLDARL